MSITKQPKVEDIHIRVTASEKSELKRISDALGLSLSAYILWCGSQYVGKKLGDVILDYHEKTGRK